jgi:hypothetical protein
LIIQYSLVGPLLVPTSPLVPSPRKTEKERHLADGRGGEGVEEEPKEPGPLLIIQYSLVRPLLVPTSPLVPSPSKTEKGRHLADGRGGKGVVEEPREPGPLLIIQYSLVRPVLVPTSPLVPLVPSPRKTEKERQLDDGRGRKGVGKEPRKPGPLLIIQYPLVRRVPVPTSLLVPSPRKTEKERHLADGRRGGGKRALSSIDHSIFSGTHLPTGSLAKEDEVLALSVPDGGLVEGQEGGACRAELSWILQHRFFCVYFFGGMECVGHPFAYVAHFVFLRRRAAIATRRATNLATHLEVTKDYTVKSYRRYIKR